MLFSVYVYSSIFMHVPPGLPKHRIFLYSISYGQNPGKKLFLEAKKVVLGGGQKVIKRNEKSKNVIFKIIFCKV